MLERLLVFSVLVPMLFWLAWHYYRDRHQPEPIAALVLCLFAGVAAAGLGRLLYATLGLVGLRRDAVDLAVTDPAGLLLYALTVIGPLEEFAKILPFLLIATRLRALDEERDGIIYASFLAIGFAAAENLHYLQFLTPLESLARGFASPIVHVLFASVWGYYCGRALLRRTPLWRAALLSFAASAVLHGLYDYLSLRYRPGAAPLAAGLILLVWSWRLVLFRRLEREPSAPADGT